MILHNEQAADTLGYFDKSRDVRSEERVTFIPNVVCPQPRPSLLDTGDTILVHTLTLKQIYLIYQDHQKTSYPLTYGE